MSLQNYEKKRNMLAFPFGKVVENSLGRQPKHTTDGSNIGAGGEQ